MPEATAGRIELSGGDAEAWAWEKHVMGSLSGYAQDCQAVTVRANGLDLDAIREGERISANVPLAEGENRIVAVCHRADGREDTSNMLTYVERLSRRPSAVIQASIDAGKLVLDGSESLLVIQDLLDAMLLQSKGFFHVAAVGKGGRGLATRRWEQLADLGIREVTLALDHDPRHGDDTLCALENAFRAGRAPAVFVVPPGAWPGPWGARGLLCREGLAALRSFLEKERMPGGQYAPRQVPSNNPAFAADDSLTEEEPERSPEPEPLASEAREKPSRQQGFCPFHQCSETTCFCFD